MEYSIAERTRGLTARELDEIACLWNRNAVGRHAFLPWTGELLAVRLNDRNGPVGKLLEARTGDGCLAGFVHVCQMREDGYPWAGVVENIMVDSPHRNHGLGGALLAAGLSVIARFRPRPAFVDALGAWPFGYAFNTLADGSERSGVFLDDAPLYRLFRRANFHPVRKSLVMRAELSGAAGREIPRGAGFHLGKRADSTWLDRVFRGRDLWDYDMVRADGRVLSRSIFGFMENESRHEGRAIFSLFGVNTPRDMQQKGYAGINLSHMMAHVRDLGGEVMELHVYADNVPALALYRSLGFRQKAETMMMHKLMADSGYNQ